MVLALLCITNACYQHRHRPRFVLVLRAPVLTFDDETGRQMGNAHRRIGLLDMLTACAGGSKVSIRISLGLICTFEFIRFRHHRRTRRGECALATAPARAARDARPDSNFSWNATREPAMRAMTSL